MSKLWFGDLLLITLILPVLTVIVDQAKTQASQTPGSILDKTLGMKKLSGYFNIYWDTKEGKLWLEIDKWRSDFLYQSSLPAGLGSGDFGLDRGQLGQTYVVRFERVGPKVLLIAQNLKYRAVSGDASERRAVRESFAESALWGFTVAAEEEHHALVDATAFFLHDALGIPAMLRGAKQGNFRLEESRCFIYLPQTKNFPLNTEVEVTLTFTGEDVGPGIFQVTPSPNSITVREHHSFAQLPPPGYERRAFDPRAGFMGINYEDFAAPLGESTTKRFIMRHRLRKKDPKETLGEPVQPIVYYLDRGAPEPVRSALLEGANWWSQAFEAAGYKNAFRVELMPEDADPMDVRYHVIQWVHRARRGWSFGASVMDPRTGEIIKAHATLDSLRVRQCYLIAEALLAPYEKGKPVLAEMQEMALARVKHLAAHEVGHTLGLVHNYSASAVNSSSVMDYPPPKVKLTTDGCPDISDAYSIGVGEWDKVAIDYGYRDFPPGTNESSALDKILMDGYRRGLLFLTDEDAAPPGSSSSVAHLWDSGVNAIDELNRIMQVRAAALRRFGENSVREGAPLATLEDLLVPVYMLHRYQVEASCKLVGGMDYTFALRGDGQVPTQIVTPAEQRRAVSEVLATLRPDVLMLPEALLEMIPPPPPDYERGPEHFKIRTAPVFDALAPAESAARHTLSFLFNPERAARLVEFHARNAENPSLGEVLDKILETTWKSPRGSGYSAEVARTVDWVALYNLMALSADESALLQVRAIAYAKLEELRLWLTRAMEIEENDLQKAHLSFARTQIAKFQKDSKISITAPSDPPPGPPI